MKQVADIDSENNHIVMKERVVDYFSTPGFLDLERLEQIQNEIENLAGMTRSPSYSPLLGRSPKSI